MAGPRPISAAILFLVLGLSSLTTSGIAYVFHMNTVTVSSGPLELTFGVLGLSCENYGLRFLGHQVALSVFGPENSNLLTAHLHRHRL